MPDRRAKFLRNSFYLSQLDGEGMRRQEEQEQLKDREADKDLMIKKFAEDFGLQLQGIKQYLQRLGLEPVRRSEFRSPEARGTPYKGVRRTADKRRRRETKFIHHKAPRKEHRKALLLEVKTKKMNNKSWI